MSETCSFDAVISRWVNNPTETPVIVIDTPGIGDSRNRDTKHIAMMVNGLKEIGYVNAFGIVLNYQEPRLSEQLQDTIKLFS